MSLDDINKEIYNSESKVIPEHVHEKSEYDPGVSANIPSPFDKEESWVASQKGLSKKQKTIVCIVAAVIGFIVLMVAIFYGYRWWQRNAFHQDRVSVSFEGPNETDSTQTTKYLIHYKNDNYVTLKNAEIQLNYTENFQPIDNVNLKYLSPTSSKIFIGDVKPMSEDTVELKGIFYAPENDAVYLYASIHFIPSGGNNELSMDGQVGVNITAAPVSLEVTAPQQLINGDDVQYVVNYKNLDTKSISNVQIKVDFPQGFQLADAQPAPLENSSVWNIGDLGSEGEGKITINGQLYGNEGQNETISASLGYNGNDEKFVVLNKYSFDTQVVSPILAIKQTLENKEDNIISAGEILKYTVDFKNTGKLGLRDTIVTVELKGKIFDFSKINVNGGSFDAKTGIATWRASEIPSLANIDPNAGGSVQFSVPVKSIIPIDNKEDKDLTATSVAKIDSPDIPISNGGNKVVGKNKLELKLASKVVFSTKAYYTDAKIKNSGPIPMKVGSETSFTVHWSILNVSSDISDGKVISALPSGVRWTGKIYPSKEKITYNERTGQLIWDIGNVTAGSGVTVPPREVLFQVAVTPQSNQVGEKIVLVNQSTFTAKDTFVDKSIKQDNNKKDTELTEDATVGYSNSKVAKGS